MRGLRAHVVVVDLVRKCGSIAVHPPTVESRGRLLSQHPAGHCFVLSEGRSTSYQLSLEPLVPP